MTTGTVGSPFSSVSPGTVKYYKKWSGGNGKTEYYGGSIRPKWNNYTVDIRSSLYPPNVVSYYRPPPYGNEWVYDPNFFWSIPAFSLQFDSNDDLRLQNKLLDRVKGHSFNLGVAAGEGHQTVRLVESNLRKLGRAALALRKGDFATAARQLGARPKGTRLKPSDISGRWLELQYGWMPLLGDVYESAKAFEAISNGPRHTTVSASRRKVVTRTVTTVALLLQKVEETYQRTIKYEMYEELSFTRQLGLQDPLSVAWELTPWSFVVDWFIPIGSYLENLNQIPRLNGRFLTTTYQKVRGPISIVPNPSNGPWCTLLTYTAAPKYVKIVLSRTVSASLPVPLPSFRAGGAVHGNRVWNAIALASQRFGRR